ncbi:hypothetical protein NQ317_019181 [Molorchus minor]|uniref:Condensin complex subunit 1 n=1 Tax=Molorchus minor TaxID=1323400 RepID=A0ABQ9J6Q1_9CUCU|nr:hypothetical protein NQ317_019181 [Molorchus minor]
MAHINFVIPTNKQELLTECDDYYVKNVVVPKDLISQLKNARQSLKDEGAEFIVDTFDVYYSVLHHADTLTMDVIFRSYEDLHKDAHLPIHPNHNFDRTEKNETKNQGLLKGRKKSSKNNEQFSVDKKSVLILLNNLIQREINIFWDPPIVEESFVNIVSEVCYRFLQIPSVKGEREVRVELFNLIGSLIKEYNHGTTFVIRMVQLIKMQEHLMHCLPEGVQQLVERFNCKGLVHDLIREVTEWQTEEQYQDRCQILCWFAIVDGGFNAGSDDSQVMYLNKYLNHESATLRNSVLSVITEVVINVLTGHDLSDEQRESRDDFLAILMEHMEDVAAIVRSKVVQQWARMQKESAIPLKYQNQVLEKVIERLFDKGAMVRKSAANCVTTFLQHNAFSANLSLSMMLKELEDKQRLLNVINEQFEGMRMRRLLELEKSWSLKCDDLKIVIEEELRQEKDKSDGGLEEQDTEERGREGEIPKEQMVEILRMYLNEGKYKEAYKLCKTAADEMEEFRQLRDNNEPHKADMYLLVLHSIFINISKVTEELRTGGSDNEMTAEDFEKMDLLEKAVDFLKDCVEFLKLIDGAIEYMTHLLETTAISDMHEAVDFFTSAYQFNLDNSVQGILAMLRIMQRNEQERKDYIINAFKTIYLNTDSANMEEHCLTIVNRLIALVKSVPVSNFDHLELIISEWTSKGVLDNSVIDMLWQYFTKKVSVNDEDSRASLALLRMSALGRKTIITRNIKLVATLAFGERGQEDMLFLGEACEFLAVAGRERIDITSKKPPFKIKPGDEAFQNLVDILCTKFFEPVEYYNKALFGGVDFIYKLCSKPEKLCEDMIQSIINKLSSDLAGENQEVERYVLTRLCQMLGFVALKHLEYLDETVYKELKRRNNIREERKQSKNSKKSKKSKARISALTAANESSLNTSIADESTLEGAQAEDTDAEFILNVLENDTVTGSGGLGKLAYIIKGVCERPNIYDDVMVQGAAVIALIRYMLVSSKFCDQNIQLLFTIFEKTNHPSEMLHSGALIGSLGEVPQHYRTLDTKNIPKASKFMTSFIHFRDPSNAIRKATFFTLANLILRDMIRAHSHISEMVCCMVDEDKELRDMCRTFFVNLSHKENNLYNVLPDIFSHLMDSGSISDNDGHAIMKFLFELMDKSKHMENLVDRFCCKFRLTEDMQHHRSIAYCLSLIQYNEKALKKLIENFPTYKHLVHDPEIYGFLKNIMQSCNKQQTGKADLKPLVSDLEKSINSVFELNEDGTMKPPPVPPKSARKTKSRKPSSKKSSRRRQESDSDEDVADTEKENKARDTPCRASNRRRRVRQVMSDSDSKN